MNQYQCYQCGMVAEDESKVKSHLSEAHNIKVDTEHVIRTFCCSLCVFTTKSMEEYKNHLINIHNKEKHNWIVEELIQSFVCEECELEFPKSEMLTRNLALKNLISDKGPYFNYVSTKGYLVG